MAVYFVETSALAKRYIAETGSVWLRALLDPSTGCSIYVVRVTAVEIVAALTRRERGGIYSHRCHDKSFADPCSYRKATI